MLTYKPSRNLWVSRWQRAEVTSRSRRGRRRFAAAPTAAELVGPPTVRRRLVEPLTLDQARAVIQALRGDRIQALYLVALGLGLRLSEVLVLHWRDVDLEQCTARIRRHLPRINGD